MSISPDLYLGIGAFLFSLDLIISGLVGLKTRKLSGVRIFSRIFLVPLGLIGAVVRSIFTWNNKEPDTGIHAVVASCSAICFGVIIAVVFSGFYLDKYKIFPFFVIEFVIKLLLILVIVAVIVGTVYFKSK